MRNRFAYPLMWNISGSLHNHVVSWKVDLDVVGRSNSVNMHAIGVRGGGRWCLGGADVPGWAVNLSGRS